MALWLAPQQIDELIALARQGAPREVCGLLGGRDGVVSEITSVANTASAPERAYQMDERGLAHALTSLARRGMSPVAFFHSHPAGDSRPSPLDVTMWAYPDVLMLIITLQPSPALSAWSVRWGEVTPVEIEMETGAPRATRPPWTTAAQIAVLVAVIAAVALFLLIALTLLPPAPPIPATPMPR